MTVQVHGTVSPGFEAVRREFGAVLAEQLEEPNAQLVVLRHGRPVVDLWAGDALTGEALTGLYSAGKGAAYLVAALAVQRGLLDLDRTVAQYWPEFAAHGKAELTVAQLLQHRSGVVNVDNGFTLAELADDDAIAARAAAQRPFWRPGEAYGYHAFVIGAMVGEVIRRATGRTLRWWYESQIRSPYRLDLYLGLPATLEHRFVPVKPALLNSERFAQLADHVPEPDSLMATAFNTHGEVTDLARFANHRRVRELGQASAGAIGNARGVAELYAAATTGLRDLPALLKPETAARFAAPAPPGVDLVTGETDHFGLGFERLRYEGLSEDAFGHGGVAGSLGFADPGRCLGYGYVRNRFAFPPGGGGAAENDRLVAAVLDAADRSGHSI